MAYVYAPKQTNAVNRVMTQLGRGSRRRVITLGSERRLTFLAGIFPNQTRAFLKNLLQLDQAGKTVQKVVVPDGLYFRMNQNLLKRLTDLEQVQQMMSEDAVIDISKQGIRRKLGYVDHVPKLKEPSLANDVETLANAEAVKELKRDVVLADLFLFRSLMAARIEVYKLGEAKSAAKRSGDKDRYDQACTKMRQYANLLAEFNLSFPFNNIDNRQKVKEDIDGAVHWLNKLNNPVADNILVTLSERILADLERAETVRFRNALSRQGQRGLQVARGKVRIVNSFRGDCVVSSSGYKNTAAGILSKAMIDHNVNTRKILSMIEHEIESARNEQAKNSAYIFGLAVIAKDPLAWFDKLYEANVLLGSVRDTGKRKALAELAGARHLLNIPQEQAHKLAGQLIDMAAHDLERRNQVLDAQIAGLTRLKEQTEELLGAVLKDLSQRWVRYFAAPDRNLRNLARLNKINSSLGKYLGTLLGPKKEDLREPWMRQARARITGVLRMMSRMAKPLREREKLVKQRSALVMSRKVTAEQSFQLRVLNGQIEALEKQIDELHSGLNYKAARLMLQIEFDFSNRGRNWKKGERQTALKAFYRSKTAEYGLRIAL